MLEELFIQDFALIKELRLNFSRGFNVITGETGSGKSIIIGALNLLLGSKATTDQIRTHSKRCIIQGSFFLPDSHKSKKILEILSQHALDSEDNMLLIKREISIEGKGRCFINYQQVPIALLKKISALMVDVHGQNKNQQILKIETHRKILDKFSRMIELNQFRKLYLEYELLKQKLISISLNQEDKARRLEILSHEIKEIEEANLNQHNELEKLIEEEKKISNHEVILSILSEVYHTIGESEYSAKSQLSKQVNQLEKIVEYDSSLQEITNRIQDVYYEVEDIVHLLRQKIENISLDKEELSKIQERINLIQKLTYKYGDTIPQILSYFEKIKNEYEGIQLSDTKAIEINHKISIILKDISDRALLLSQKRKKYALELESQVKRELKELGMADSQFQIQIQWSEDPNGDYLDSTTNKKYKLHPYGLDQVEFLIGAFETEKVRSLRKTASGGEMSRIMLALKKIIIDADPVFTMIFDEVDSGVGGGIAEIIGDKLLSLSNKSQVIVITHLQQIASKTSKNTSHFKVTKNKESGTSIIKLNKETRLQEIARMISGTEITSSALEHAKKLLQ